jgi:GTP cyclohydrolase I
MNRDVNEARPLLIAGCMNTDDPLRCLEATNAYVDDAASMKVLRLGSIADDLGPCKHILEGPITFIGKCQHETLACFGRGWFGYVTREDAVGAKPLQRMFRRLARRFELDGSLAAEVANELLRNPGVIGAAVRVEGAYLSFRIGGICGTDGGPHSVSFLGAYLRKPRLQEEFLSSCR